MLKSDWSPIASDSAFLSVGSTWKVSAMQDCATSTDSASSALIVPSLSEVERKSMMASARRFLDSPCEAYRSVRAWIDVRSK